MSTPSIDLSPKGLLNESGNYVLQQPDVANLVKYAWAGVLLPDNADALETRLKVSPDTLRKLSGVLAPLLVTFTEVSILTSRPCQS